jgi:hypothetical protein
MDPRIGEILSDLFALLYDAFTSPQGIKVLDEVGQVLGLPDFFPHVDGFADGKTAPSTKGKVEKQAPAPKKPTPTVSPALQRIADEMDKAQG